MASAAPLSLGSAADLVNVAIQRIWLKSSDLYKTTYFDKFMNVESGITDCYMKDSSVTGLGEATRITEQSVITAEVPVQGFDQNYTQIEYGKLLPVTKKMLTSSISWMETSLYKFRKLRETLSETIRSQATAIKKAVEGSTTIIGTPVRVMG